MEPRIQYATTRDGVNIAYFHIGGGVPLVRMPTPPFDHIRLRYATWGRAWCDAVASRTQLVCYDGRGSGLSTREVTAFSLDTFLEDLRSVVDALAIQRFVLVAEGAMAPVALAFAAGQPERVSHLIIHSGTACNSELWLRRVQSTHAMLTNAPDVYSLAVSGMIFGTGSDAAKAYADFILQCADVRVARRMLEAQYLLDVSALLEAVRAPALVTCVERDGIYNRESITKLAAVIGGTLSVLSPRANLEDWALHDLPETMAFLVEQGVIADGATTGKGDTQTNTAAPDATLRTVLFTDVVGHTEMMSRLGDERGREVLREHERITREVLKAHGGTEVKTMGDGFMASFGSVTKAVECAVALQREIGNWKSEIGERMAVRCGLNAGEPIEEEGDLFGATVILASRIAAKAEGGEILVADTVRGLCSGKGFLFADRGEFVAKGFEEPVRVYEVRWRE